MLKIRAATPDDSENISQLICRLVEKFVVGAFSAQGRNHLLSTLTVEAIDQNLQSDYRYHVAEVNGSLTGVVAVKGDTHLYHLFVAEQFHHQGIAKALWHHAMKECLDGDHMGEFTVNSSEYALGVYKKLGFVAQSGPREKKGVVFYPMKLVTRSRS